MLYAQNLKLCLILIFMTNTVALEAQQDIKRDTFNIPVNPKGYINGVHYYQDGINGPLILFSGGANESQETYEKLAIQLAKQGYHVITHDLRGHGKSTAPLTNAEALRGKRNDPPIYDQATHDGLELYHGSDLEAVYQYAIKLPGVYSKETILGLASTSVMFWSSNMIIEHPEIKNFILLTAGYYSRDLGRYFSEKSGFNILTVLSEGQGHPGEKGVKANSKRTEDYFAQNKNHNVKKVYCKSGFGNDILATCAKVEKEVLNWAVEVRNKAESTQFNHPVGKRSVKTQIWENKVAQEWKEYRRVKFNYNAENQLVEQIINTVAGQLQTPLIKVSFSYGKNGNTITRLTESWDGQKWFFAAQNSFLYTEDRMTGREDIRLTQSGTTVISIKLEYDNKGNVVSEIGESVVDGKKVNYNKAINHYNESGLAIKKEFYLWSDGAWKNLRKMHLEYDDQGHHMRTTRFNWVEGTWVENLNYELTVDQSGNRLIELWQRPDEDGNWTDFRKVTYVYE